MACKIIRVEPLSSWLEPWKAPASAVTRYGHVIYVSGFPPFDPQTGERQKLTNKPYRDPSDKASLAAG